MTHPGHDPDADAAAEHRFELVMSVVDPPKPSQDFVTGSESAPNPGDPGTVGLLMATPRESGPGDKIVVVWIEALPGEVDDLRNIIRSIYESAHS